MASTDVQKALAELVGWTGCLGTVRLIALVARFTYRPDVDIATLLDPRAAPTRTVSLAVWDIVSVCETVPTRASQRVCTFPSLAHRADRGAPGGHRVCHSTITTIPARGRLAVCSWSRSA